jgi:hypothetical protein
MTLGDTATLAYPRKLVEQIILGLYAPVNEHLVKLIGFNFAPDLRQHFRRELRTWLRKIQALRFKPSNRTGSFKFYFDLLFDYPFGGVEVRNIRLIMDEIADEHEVSVRRRARRRWSHGCETFTPPWPSVCTRARPCSI